jgi:hypothetical protein
MRVFSLFELFLAVLAVYAIFQFEGIWKILFPCLCLFSDFLFEKLKKRLKENPRPQS